MAPLIVETARAARAESVRARGVSFELRAAVRENTSRAHAGTEKAAAAGRRTTPTPSPWSALEWSREDEHLGRVLVPLG